MEQHIKNLFSKYLSGNPSAQDLAQLYDYFQIEQNEQVLDELISNHLKHDATESIDQELATRISTAAWTGIEQQIPSYNRYLRMPFVRIAAAAILLIAGISSYLFITNKSTPSQLTAHVYGQEVTPGANRATITLDGRKTFELDSKGSIAINKDHITYSDGTELTSTTGLENATITIPRGGQYQLTLSDGTKVFLNAASSLSYPLSFAVDRRHVVLDGEAYFEVAKDKKRPFTVKSGAQTLTVLGTHFNVQAYDEEAIETTLIEGKVSLSDGAATATLLPGQQAVLRAGAAYQMQTVNAEEYTAWMRNRFIFNSVPLSNIFKALERWYDVDITYPQSMGAETYYIEFKRDRKLSELLETLSPTTQLKFSIEGRRVIAERK